MSINFYLKKHMLLYPSTNLLNLGKNSHLNRTIKYDLLYLNKSQVNHENLIQ